MVAKIDPEIGECLDILIGCLREMQRRLWQEEPEVQQAAVKDMPELDVMARTIEVLRRGNYEQAREARTEAERQYLT